MIFISILIHFLGNLAPKWIFKDYYLAERNKFSWKYSLFQLSGIITTLLFTFILVSIFTLTSTTRYIENKNAIYGLKFSENLQSIGFEDGDKIISINGNELGRVSRNIVELILPEGQVKVLVEKNGITRELSINESDKPIIWSNHNSIPMEAIMYPNEYVGGSFDEVKLTEVPKGLSDIPSAFGIMWNQVTRLIFPSEGQVGGFKAISEIENLHVLFSILALTSMFIGIINLLPLPGFSIGNMGLTIIEKNRGQHFSKWMFYILQSLSIAMVSIFILISVYY